MNQEAVLSSKIEGTQATLEEVLEHQAGQEFSGEKEKDIQEILNYRKVLMLSQEEVRDRPIRLALVLQLHKILMESVRGENKTPGQFRKTQNWVGAPGSTIENASYVPPSPMQLMDHLVNWENFLSFQDIDPLLQTSIVHAQFELIHPFLDGNGRVGRLLIPLFLFHRKRLDAPTFYISEFLESHRDEYYSRLQRISRNGEWDEWNVFFLNAVIKQADLNIAKVKKIIALYSELQDRVRMITKSKYAQELVDVIFARPVLGVKDLIERSKVPKATAHKLIKLLLDAKILVVLKEGAGRRPSILSNYQLLDIVK